MKATRLAFSCLLLAFSSLSYEFVLAQMMSILGGHTVLFYCLTIGLYIFALGAGSLVSVEERDETWLFHRLFWVEGSLSVLGGGIPLWMIGLDGVLGFVFQSGIAWPYLTLIPHALLIVAIGFLSGMELPLILRLAEAWKIPNFLTRLLGLDYIASFLGAISCPIFFFPQFGIIESTCFLALINLLALLLIVPFRYRSWPLYITLSFALIFVYAIVRSDDLNVWLSAALYQ